MCRIFYSFRLLPLNLAKCKVGSGHCQFFLHLGGVRGSARSLFIERLPFLFSCFLHSRNGFKDFWGNYTLERGSAPRRFGALQTLLGNVAWGMLVAWGVDYNLGGKAMSTNINEEVRKAILTGRGLNGLTRSQQSWDLSGCDGRDPYTESLMRIVIARKVLDELQKEIVELQEHKHDWNEDGICGICGWNGNV